VTDTNVISAFQESQVTRLTGISESQIRYWHRNGFFTGSFSFGDKPSERLYSFRDLVCLKVVNTLRNEANVSLQELRAVKETLAHLGDDLWAKTTLYVLNKHVIFDNPATNSREEVVSGQAVLQIPLKVVAGDMKRVVADAKKRSGDVVGSIERKRGMLHSRPMIAGTRVPVEAIKAFVDAGYSAEDILRQYPFLLKEDVEAAIGYDLAS